ncbi:GNAT family N-acetyltransferase [Paenibacillus sp. V4I7]|uniref:GNAT family N-acetyltransferase n=1 Tax=Paenibacillus sp. V4I7 TaxID=3042307 RepID=UPI002788B430|nr:GNAT family N-acetyltransferase [Paenibacillus sp. V4I7]MDQ0898626.1 GNAT superfamily N-acetyltransferase [Paenibacillus sp. V4I7]
MIRLCEYLDKDVIYQIINDAAQAYEGVIPYDMYHEPYMTMEELNHEMNEGVMFWGLEENNELLGVMGIQDKGEVSLIRHAYVKTNQRKGGIGTKLLNHLINLTDKPIETIEWASRAGIQTLNMHLNNGIYFTLPHERMWINKQYETEFNKLLYESYSQLYQLANSLDVVLSIENTCNFHIPFIRRALEMLAKFENFHLTWDVGHDAKVNFKEEVVFREFTDRIKHMHLHDCNDKSDHQPLYNGNVPINDRLLFAENYGLSVVIEVKTSTSLRESVEQLKKNYK